MRSIQSQLFAALGRAQQFLDAEPLASNARIAGVRTRLDRVVEALRGHALEQEDAFHEGRGDVARRKALSRALRDHHMRPIIRAARAFFGPRSAVAAEFRMPKRGDGTEELLAAAGALREAGARHQQRFVDSGMAPDFLAQLDAAAGELRDAVVGRGKRVGRRAGATAGLEAAAGQGRRMLALLDALVARELRDDPERLSEWRSVSHVRQLAARPADAADAPAAQPGPSTPAPSAAGPRAAA